VSTLHTKELGKISKLYLELGYSMQSIADEYNTSLNAVVYFMRKHGVPRRTGGQTRYLKWENAEASFTVREAKTEKQKILDAKGAMLYWGEGYKTGKAKGIDFANSDPKMAKLFIDFLRDRYSLQEEKFRIALYVHLNQEIEVIIKYWSALLSIPKAQFTKPYIAKARNSKNKRKSRMEHGLVHIRYHDKKLLKDMLSLIESHSTR
jgi:hypothetical protein